MDRARIADIEAKISGLKESIRALRIEQVQAQKRLDSYKYPVLTLPNEIISEIFVHFIPVYPLHPPLKGIFSPTLLTHICRQWRDIAHVTPALWRATSVDFTNSTSDKEDNNILQPWVARSRTYPLSISIHGYYGDKSQCMETLSSHRALWEHLELSYVSYDILLYLRDPMPTLRHLDVSFQDEFDAPVTVGDAPLLRSARISVYVDNIVLPWQQLTSLHLASIFPGECTAILQQAALLIHCTLSFISDDDDGPDPQPDINLPLLESFILTKGDLLQTSYLYNLILPALDTLQIPEEELRPDPIGGLRSFFSKSGCTLRELRIAGDRTFAQAAYRRAFPAILEISFEEDCEAPSESDSE
ncbi:hypothetical protein C8R43DRAFT_1058313 [Mycena crocata]|nr:hypothetical protein C8R43DRAFT_1058313 [Mycena crocata]